MNFSYLKKATSTILVITALMTAGSAAAQNYRLPGQHTAQSEDLLANQTKVKPNTLITPSVNYLDIEQEVVVPEGELYEYGWKSNMVNCYKGMEVANRAIIDVRNFHMPHPGYLTSPYGWRERFQRMHRGVDIHINMGDTIRAAFDGKVRITKYEAAGYGYYVVLRHYNQLETVYGHLSKFLVKNDQYVKAGDPIALGGNTGRSTGPHLHFETRYMGYAINPAAIFDFANQTTHTDTYTFDKKTYELPRNFSPAANAEYAAQYNKANPRTNSTSAKSDNKAKKESASANQYVTVKNGDSLSKIASRNHTTVDKLCKLNGVTTKTNIKPGQKLKVK